MKPLDHVAQRIEELRARFAIKGMVDVEAGRGSLPSLVIHNAYASAVLYLHGAHLTHYQPKGRGPLLWLSDWSWFEDGKPIRGGVPICWPWFAAHTTDPNLPPHGFVRLVEWQLVSVLQLPDGRTRIELALADEDVRNSTVASLLNAFPHSFSLRFSVTVGACLEMALTVGNRSENAFSFEEALHTYLSVGDVGDARVRGLGGMQYLDKTQSMKVCKQEADELLFEGETDRVYVGSKSGCELVDHSLSRTTEVSKDGSATTVIWNPHKQKAKAMPDFGEKEWQGMVCVEAANVGSEAVRLDAGAEHTIRAVLKVR